MLLEEKARTENKWYKVAFMVNKLLRINRIHYDKYWEKTTVYNPKIWAHWQIIQKYINNGYGNNNYLELGSGTRPKLPIKNSYFLDISTKALKKISSLGGKTYVSDLTKRFPFPNNYFNLICAFEILEHLPNDVFVLKEIHRTLKPNGICLISFPLNQCFWNKYDEVIGHVRRYHPEQIDELFVKCNLKITHYAKIPIPWPGKFSGLVLSFFIKKLPSVVYRLQEWLDLSTFSPLRKPIRLRQWKNNSHQDLNTATTGLFMAEKRS